MTRHYENKGLAQRSTLNTDKQDKYKMYHISLLWQCWALSVERWEQFTMRAFPWKFISQGFFLYRCQWRECSKIRTTLYDYGITPAFTTLFWKPDGCKGNPLLTVIDRRIRGNSIYKSIKLLRYYSVQTQLNFNNSCLALNLSRNRLWPSGILPRGSTSK